MPIPGTFFSQLGAELQTLRGLEAVWEWMTKVSGASTYFKDKINAAYDNTVQREDDAETASKDGLKDTTVPGLVSASSGRKSGFESYFFPFMDLAMTIPQTDRDGGAITYDYDPTLEAAGEIRIVARRGRWGALRREMIAAPSTIKKNVIAFGALAAPSTNQGVLALSGVAVGSDHTLGGEFTFSVVDDTVGAEKLAVNLALTNPLVDGTVSVAAERNLQVDQFFGEGQTGLDVTLVLGPVDETGDDGAIFSATTVQNRSEADSAKGKHFITVKRLAVGGAGPHFRVSWYRSGSLALTDQVTTQDVTGEAGSVPLALVGSESTISTTFDKTAAAAFLPLVDDIDSDIVFDLKIPRIGDRWTMTVTNDEAGLGATKIARRWRASLNSDAAPTISDALFASIAIT